MIDPDIILDATVSAFQSITEVITSLDGDTSSISGHHFLFGAEVSLAKRVYNMNAGTILIAYLDLIGGNFSGMGVWKHRLEVYIRPKSAVPGSGAGPIGCSPYHLWYLLMNKPVTSISPGTLNLRQVELLPGLTLLDAMPPLRYTPDENQSDLFTGSLVYPETGDQP